MPLTSDAVRFEKTTAVSVVGMLATVTASDQSPTRESGSAASPTPPSSEYMAASMVSKLGSPTRSRYATILLQLYVSSAVNWVARQITVEYEPI